MRVQVIVYDAFLKNYFSIHLWSIHEVIRMKGSGYYVRGTCLYGNRKGQPIEVWLKSTEVKILTQTNNNT